MILPPAYIGHHPPFPICTVTSPITRLWHQPLGHINPHRFRSMGSKGVAYGVPLIYSLLEQSPSCFQGKQAQTPVSKLAI